MQLALKMVLPILLIIGVTAIAKAETINLANPKLLEKMGFDEEYSFISSYSLKHGLSSYTYVFGTEKNQTILFTGYTFGDAETCPANTPKYKGLMESTLVKQGYIKKDFNDDGIEDINLSIAERNCLTDKIKFTEVLILSDGTKYKTQTITSQE